MADNDYICVYRQFFEEFSKTSEMYDCLLMRVSPYNLSTDELVGEVMNYCVNYLAERKCPRSLVVPLTKIVVEEFINEAKKLPEEVNTPLQLNKRTVEKILEVCMRYTDNEKLSNLPGPIQETHYSTHSTKHTRRRMEDRLICFPRFNTLHNVGSNTEAGYYGIFDGHGGVTAASYAVAHLHQFLAESEHYPDEPVKALREAFEKTEIKFNSKDENCGTAALVVLHQPVEKKITVAWVGDSQAMLVNEDSYVMLVDPHKPERTDERKRIEELKGCVIRSQSIYRVNGLLAISRAIGDKKLKPFVSAEPEIRAVNLTGSEHFIVMGCDGLWDVVEPQEVIETVYFEVKKNEGQIDSVARKLVDLAKKNNSTDNISVIVIFLTDPAEINNHSVDVTGHRPKILHQDGVIMEANFETNDKSPFGDPNMNGLYETNSNHFDMQNGSDEDFGPETDVDAVDDVLTSPKNLNPFSKECWQKSGEENQEKLIEYTHYETDQRIGEFNLSEDLTASIKFENVEDTNQSPVAMKGHLDCFLPNNGNAFDIPVMNNNISDAPIISNNFSDDNNKYVDEINSRKEEVEEFMTQKFNDQTFELKNEANLLEVSQTNKSASPDLFGSEANDLTNPDQSPAATTPDSNLFSTGDKEQDHVEKLPDESPVTPAEENVPVSDASFNQFNLENPDTTSNEHISSETNEPFCTQANDPFSTQAIETVCSQTNEMDVLSSQKDDDVPDVETKVNFEANDLIEQSTPQDVEPEPELCSVVDVVEAAKASQNFSEMDENVVSKETEPSPELLSLSTPALEGEVKDETVAESGGEVEDSEDDEWNYIKVESGNHQGLPLDSKESELVPPSTNELSEAENPIMNSPLNPDADEFIPGSVKSSNNEYNFNTTPKKAIPGDLTDIIASSPNWNNMNHVNVPDESAFLNEIKSRPSNMFENMESPTQEVLGEQMLDVSNTSFTPPVEANKENEVIPQTPFDPQKELHGLDLASDMTSSFIDPSTITSEVEPSKDKIDEIMSPVEEPVVEKKESFLSENVVKVEEFENVEASKLPDLLSPVSVQEGVPPVTFASDMSKQPEVAQPEPVAVETVVSDVIQSPTITTEESKPAESTPIITPTEAEQPPVSLPPMSETIEKAVVEEKPVEVPTPKTEEPAVDVAKAATAVAAAATVGAAAAGVAAVKKDAKKPTTKPSTATSKTPGTTKPLLNGTKTSAPPKKPTPSTQVSKTSTPGKTATTTTSPAASKTTRVSSTTKPQPRLSSVTSTLSKTTPRPRVTAASATTTTSTVTKASTPPKTSVTASLNKPNTTTLQKTAAKTTVSTTATTLKSKPRVSSATVEKKTTTTTSTMNGNATTIKRTEITSKKPGGPTTTTTTTTRVSLTARPASAPQKPTTLKTTTATTRTATTRPKTTLASSTTASSPTSKPTPAARKSTIGAEKQAKEVANRLTSKTGLASKANGVAHTTAKTTKTTLTSTTSKTQKNNKTETKAEKIIEKVEVIQSENGAPIFENKTDINLINSIASEDLNRKKNTGR